MLQGTVTSFLQLTLALDEKGKDKMEAWHGRQADVHTDQMELGLQEDQEIPAWKPAGEHNMLAYKGVGNTLAFEQRALW